MILGKETGWLDIAWCLGCARRKYEGARTWFIQRKGWHNARTQIRNELDIEGILYKNYEILETTLFSYVLLTEKNVRIDKNADLQAAYEAREAEKAKNAAQ